MKNKTVKKILAVALSTVMAAGMLAGCGSKDTQEQASEPAQEESADTEAEEETTEESAGEAGGETYKIGVIQYMPHTALDASNERAGCQQRRFLCGAGRDGDLLRGGSAERGR